MSANAKDNTNATQIPSPARTAYPNNDLSPNRNPECNPTCNSNCNQDCSAPKTLITVDISTVPVISTKASHVGPGLNLSTSARNTVLNEAAAKLRALCATNSDHNQDLPGYYIYYMYVIALQNLRSIMFMFNTICMTDSLISC